MENVAIKVLYYHLKIRPFSGTAVWIVPVSSIQQGSRGNSIFTPDLPVLLSFLIRQKKVEDFRAPNLKVLDDLVQNRTLKREI